VGASFFHSPWLWYSAAIALASLAAALLLWALFADRSRGRARCPRCWYDMSAPRAQTTGANAWTCPECGKAGTSTRALHRTRRRRAWACTAILLLAGAWLLAEMPIVRQRGWMWLVPTWLLVQGFPLQGHDGPLGMELERRLGRAPWPGGQYELTISGRQIASLFETCADGTWLAYPVSERWRNSFGLLARHEMFQVYHSKVRPAPSGAMQQAAPLPEPLAQRVDDAIIRLERLHGPLTARTRSKWPRGMPIHIEAPVETWWSYAPHHRSVIRWSVAGGEAKGDTRFTGHSEIRVPGEGHIRLNIEIDWVEFPEGTHSTRDERVVDHMTTTLEYDVVDTIDDVIPPISSPAIDAALAGLYVERDGRLDWNTLATARAAIPATTSAGFRIEFMLEGRVIGIAWCRCMGGTGGVSGHFSGPDVPDANTWDEATRMLNDPRLTACIVTDPQWALDNIDATSYWQGEAPVTLKPPKK
jgi:hypothetical protein